MKAWLVSYPRSGNTFFRNVLWEVYGIESSTFHLEESYPIDPGFESYDLVKTHLLPEQLPAKLLKKPVIYLIRDGRDCAVSLARYRQELLDPKSNYRINLEDVILAQQGSHFGGWSHHVQEWSNRASIVIRFEELIKDPINCLEQLRPWIDLPEPEPEKVPAFQQLKTNDYKYGSGYEHGFDQTTRQHWREGKFRRGIVGSWKDEFPEDLILKFLIKHGETLHEFGYIDEPKSLLPKEESGVLYSESVPKAPLSLFKSDKPKILVDGLKLLGTQIDGISRCVRESLLTMHSLMNEQNLHLQIDVALGYLGVVPLEAVIENLIHDDEFNVDNDIHPLFHTGDSNPIVQTQEHIERITNSGEPGLFQARMRLKYHRLQRSFLKRYGYLKNFLKRPDRGYDLCHLMLPNTWQHYQTINAPLLMTVHDLSHLVCPDLQDSSNIKTLERGISFAEKHRADYLSVSLSTKQQMMELLDIPSERIRVIHNGISREKFDRVFDPRRLERVSQKYQLPNGPFFLCLGTIEPRKNLINTISAFHQLLQDRPNTNAHLVLAGGSGWQQIEELQTMIQSEPRISYIGYVDDDDLSTLYSIAHATCYASFYEGFGLPLLESMACGTPVIYGNNSSMPEIARDCGLPAEAESVKSIQRAFERMLDEKALHLELTQNAYLRGRSLGWDSTVQKTLDVYQALIEQANPCSHMESSKKSTSLPKMSGQSVKRKQQDAA